MMNNLKNKSFLKKLGKIGAGLFSVSRHSSRPQKGRAFWRTENKFHIILAVIILLAVFVPWHQAIAQEQGWIGYAADWWTDKAEKAADAISGTLMSLSIEGILNTLQKLFLLLIGTAISWAAGLLDSFIRFQIDREIFDIETVRGSWALIRNFVNLFFILVLIIMAFGTIFNIQKYTWKNMLAPFLIAALLINFSLAIGIYVIRVSNGLSGVFLKEIMEVAGRDGISGIFAQGATISKSASIVNQTAGLLVEGVFSLIFLVIFFLALFATAIFALVRIFMLWFLLIISPIAWFGYAMPNLRSGTWSNWWRHFLCWCFWLPYFLFFVMFAVIFITGRATMPTLPNFSGNLMFYALSLIFLIGGMGIARKLACASGTGVSAAFGKIEGGVRKYAPGAARARGAYAGLKERDAEIQEKGLWGFGGERKARIKEAEAKGFVASILKGEFGGRLGLGKAERGMREERARVMATEVDKEIKRLQTLNLTLDQLNERLIKGGTPEGLAALKLKAENEWLTEKDADLVANTIRSVGGGRNAMGVSLIQSLRKGRFHEMAKDTKSKEDIFSKYLGVDLELAKAFGTDMAESRELLNEKLASTLLDLYKSDAGEAKRKIAESVKKNIENFARKKEDRAAFLLNPGTDKRIRKMVGETMVDKKEINNLQSRQAVIDLIGRDTPEGKEAIKNIGAFNSLLNIEAKLREERGIPIDQPLSEADNERVLTELKDKLQEKLVKNELKEIKAMSPDFFKDSRFREAAQEVFADPADMTRLVKDAPRDLRVAVKDLPGATRTPRRTT